MSRLASVFIADVLNEKKNKDVVLVLRGIHSAAQLVAARPERAIEVGFLYRHSLQSCQLSNVWRCQRRKHLF